MESKAASAWVLIALLLVSATWMLSSPIGGIKNVAGAFSDSFSIFAPAVNGLVVSVNGGSNSSRINQIGWDWGDGSSSTGWFPATHTYASSGYFAVNATAYFSDGNVLSSLVFVRVHLGDQISLFPPAINGSTVDGSSIVDINGGAGSSSGFGVNSILFVWGDGSNSYGWFPTSHRYNSSGNYLISVTAYFNDESSVSTSVNVILNPGELNGGNMLRISSTSGGSVTYNSSLGYGTLPSGGSAILYLAMEDNLLLVANPFPRNNFTSWTATSGISFISPGTRDSSSSYVVVDSDANITGNFVSVLANASLVVSSSIGGYTNPVAGVYSVSYGLTFNVTAIPNSGYSFAYWLLNGSYYDSTTSVSVFMDGNYSLEAIFAGVSHAIYLSNNIMGVTIQNGTLGTGTFTIETGAGHPNPNENVLFGGADKSPGTTFTTFRVQDTQHEYVTLPGGYTNPSSGYTALSLDGYNPVATQLSGNTATISWTTSENLVVTLLIAVHGTTVSDTAVEMTVTIKNNDVITHSVAVRHELDLMVDGSDNSWFRPWTNPSTSQGWTATETDWGEPSFQFWETTNDPSNPMFSIYGSSTLPNITPLPTAPDRLVYASWGGAINTAYDYTPSGQIGMDSAVLYYWSAVGISPGQQISRTAYLTTVVQSALSSLAWSTNSDGVNQTTFQPSDRVYAAGNNFPSNTNVQIYLIPDGQQASPTAAVATALATTNGLGVLPTTLVWSTPLTSGQYDIWVDVNKNGVFDAGDIWNNQAGGIYAFNVVSPTNYTLTMQTVGQGTVQPGNATFIQGTIVNIVAIPAVGWSFLGWSGDVSGSGNTTVTMDGNMTVTATFVRNTYSVVVNVVGQGFVGRNATEPYVYGQAISLTAFPQEGWGFSYWTGGSLSGSANPAEIVMIGNVTVTATFVQLTYSLSVSSGVGGSTSPVPGSYSELSGSSVQVTAMQSSGYAFSYWLLDGNNVGNANPIVVSMAGDHSLQAVFASTLTSPSAYASANTIDQGQSSTLAVTGLSGGALPYSYQWLWRIPGASTYSSISAATTATFSFLTSASTVSGSYYFELQVTDSVGEHVTSSNALVQVNVSPNVTVSPASWTMDVGQSKTFAASASGGTGTLSYQWYLGGSAVVGATNTTWTFVASSTGSPSIYVRITDQASSPVTVQSNNLTVTVNSAPLVVVSPSSWTMDVGQSKTFAASASGGTGTLSYQWYLGGSAVSGQTGATYSFSTSSQSSPSIYVMVTDQANTPVTVRSSTLNVTINSVLVAPTASAYPSAIEQGQPINLSATGILGGTGPYSYQWFGRAPAAGSYSSILGATTINCSLTTNSSTVGGSWLFMLQVTDAVGGAMNSNAVTVTVNSALAAPGVYASAGTVDQGQGSSLTSDSISTGTPLYSYQWLEEAPSSSFYLPISGATSPTYTFLTSTSTATGIYYFELRVTDGVGAVVNSSSVTILVNLLPSVTISPKLAVSDVGQSKSFSSTLAGGTSPFSFQWYQNGIAVLGAIGSTYAYTSTLTGTDAIYVRVTDNCGEVAVSDTVSVTVYSKLLAPSLNVSSTAIDQGQSVTFNSSLTTGIETVKYTKTPSLEFTEALYSPSSHSSTSTGFSSIRVYSLVASLAATSGTAACSAQWLQKAPTANSYTPISGATSPSYSFATTASTAVGNWSFELQITDTAGVVVTSEPVTVVVNSQLCAPSAATGSSVSKVNQGQAFVLTSAEVSSGTSPYSYQWFVKNPNVESYSLIADASSPTYDFATATSTIVGTWSFLLQVTDSAGAAANSTEITVVVNSASSTRLSVTNPSIWMPSVPSAVGANVVAIAAFSVVSAVMSSAVAGGSAASAGGGLFERIKELVPEGFKKWLEDLISSRRKRSVMEKKRSAFMPTRPELLAYTLAIVILTVCFAYVKVPNLSQMLQVIPTILATSILVEIVKSYSVALYARSRGVWTEHKLWYTGTVMLLITAFVFRMPFSKPSRNEHHSPKITEKIEGYISSVEVVIALWFATGFFILLLAGFGLIGGTGLAMCLTMAFCDTFPVAPMNGKNIFKHSKGIWAGLFTLTLALYALWLLLL